MAEVLPNLVKAIEFRRISPNGLIKTLSFQEVILSPIGYHSVRALSQEKHKTPFRVVRNFSALPKSTLLWIFETGFSPGIWENGIGKRLALRGLALPWLLS
jgi:hypothetical protein